MHRWSKFGGNIYNLCYALRFDQVNRVLAAMYGAAPIGGRTIAITVRLAMIGVNGAR